VGHLVRLTLLVTRLRNRRTDETGAVVVLVAAMSLIFFGIAALVVDLGQARVVRREAQAASDSSALAGMNAMYVAGTKTPDLTGAVAAAKSYAAKNYRVTESDWDACEDPSPLTYVPDMTQPCISFDSATEPTTIRVIAPLRTVELHFAAALGFDEVDIAAQAQASVRIGGESDCGLCVIGHSYHDLQNGDAFISGGNVAINGDVNIQNNGLVSTDGLISVEGNATGPLDGYTPDPLTGQQPVVDPLVNAPLPTAPYGGLTVKADPCGAGGSHGPGIYGAINFANGMCTLQPGLYVITGKWAFAGGAALDATGGVTLFFTCGTPTSPNPCASPGQDGGWLDASGNGDVSVTAPTSGPWKGLAIVYDRFNKRDLNLSGNGSSLIVGTIYSMSGKLRYDGNGCAKTNQALIVVNQLEFNGSPACLKSDYTLSANVYVPPDQLHLSK
jgi:hypothetical protein